MTYRALIILLMARTFFEAEAQKKKSKDPPGFVYGHISGVEGLRHVYIQMLGKVYVGRINRPTTEALASGSYYFEKVPPGEYYLAGFSIRGGDLFWIPYTKESVQDALFTVSSDEVVFMGAIEISNVKTGGFKQGSFEMKALDKPGKKAVIREILPTMDGDSPWKSKLQASGN